MHHPCVHKALHTVGSHTRKRTLILGYCIPYQLSSSGHKAELGLLPQGRVRKTSVKVGRKASHLIVLRNFCRECACSCRQGPIILLSPFLTCLLDATFAVAPSFLVGQAEFRNNGGFSAGVGRGCSYQQGKCRQRLGFVSNPNDMRSQRYRVSACAIQCLNKFLALNLQYFGSASTLSAAVGTAVARATATVNTAGRPEQPQTGRPAKKSPRGRRSLGIALIHNFQMPVVR